MCPDKLLASARNAISPLFVQKHLPHVLGCFRDVGFGPRLPRTERVFAVTDALQVGVHQSGCGAVREVDVSRIVRDDDGFPEQHAFGDVSPKSFAPMQ